MPPPSEPILAIDHLVKRFGGVTAVDDCSFAVKGGGITGLIGPNGSGKTTTFNVISGLESPDAGSVTFDGTDITRHKPHQVTRLGVGRTFQITRVFPEMTVMENMVVAAPPGDLRAAAGRAIGLLDLIGMGSLRDEFAANLSYGQRKLVEIARVHMRPHRIVLLDEPFAGVNRTLANSLIRYLRAMRDQGVTYLIIDHEMRIIMDLCGYILVMDQGALLVEGAPEVVQEHPEVMAAYFGRE
ncbi:MAG: ABC transporter ATP-binding protein [Euzebyales bacterium]|nr:ABC transporter ATP-binding protein [Euzebyales bacterium]MBA3621646.1 ABC transporter ATP-binding protein [Euzebyales bacterium]